MQLDRNQSHSLLTESASLACLAASSSPGIRRRHSSSDSTAAAHDSRLLTLQTMKPLQALLVVATLMGCQARGEVQAGNPSIPREFQAGTVLGANRDRQQIEGSRCPYVLTKLVSSGISQPGDSSLAALSLRRELLQTGKLFTLWHFQQRIS